MATNSNRPMREPIEFPFNMPVAIRLKYSQAKPCQNGERAMFSTQDGRVLFLDLEQGRQIEQMNIKPGEPILITRQKQGDKAATWLIQRSSDLAGQLKESLKAQSDAGRLGEQGDGTFAVPAVGQGKPVGQAKASAALLEESTALIDTFAEAWKYAREKYQGAVKPEEVRALVVTAYIQRSKLSSVA